MIHHLILVVVAQEKLAQLDTVYNIEVDEFHTYHVGRLGTWVHNANCCQLLNTGEIIPTTGNKVLGIKYEPTNNNSDYIIEATKGSTKGKLIKPQYYENPGHHDLKGNNQVGYNSSKSVLPSNHVELWGKSIFASDGNRWTIEIINGTRIYHRFANDNHGNFHWNGSTNGITASGTSRKIETKYIPYEILKSGR